MSTSSAIQKYHKWAVCPVCDMENTGCKFCKGQGRVWWEAKPNDDDLDDDDDDLPEIET